MKINFHIFVDKEHLLIPDKECKNISQMGKDRKYLLKSFQESNKGFVRVFSVINCGAIK